MGGEQRGPWKKITGTSWGGQTDTNGETAATVRETGKMASALFPGRRPAPPSITLRVMEREGRKYRKGGKKERKGGRYRSLPGQKVWKDKAKERKT